MPSDFDKKRTAGAGNRSKRPVSNKYDKYDDDDLDEILESASHRKKENHVKKSSGNEKDHESASIDSINYEDDFNYDIELDFEDEDYFGDYDDDEDESVGFLESFTKGKMAIIAGVFTSIVLIIMVFIAAFAGREVKGQNYGTTDVQGTPVPQKATPVVNKNENGEMISASLNVTLVPGYVMPESGSGYWGGNQWGGGSGNYEQPTETPVIEATPTPDVGEDPTPTPTPDVGEDPTPTAEVSPTPDAGEDPTPTAEVSPTPDVGEDPTPTAEVTEAPTPDVEQPTEPAGSDPTTEPSDDASL